MIDYQSLAGRIERGEIKALSIKQPYPHHIFHDGKDVENRDWATRGRGWFIVHAGISKTEIDKDDPKEMAMPRGGVVGMARIVDCVESMESRWFFGKYGFVLRDAFPLPLIPCKGALGFFQLPPEVNKQIAWWLSDGWGLLMDYVIGTMCARCRVRVNPDRDCLGESGIYSPNRAFTLCEPCFLEEDREISEHGNDLPQRIEMYRANLRAGPLNHPAPVPKLTYETAEEK